MPLSYLDIVDYYTHEIGLSDQQQSFLEGESSFWESGDSLLEYLIDDVTVFILVGTWEASEMYDRVVANKIVTELDSFFSLVLTDRYWFDVVYPHALQYCQDVMPFVITVGGPNVNAYSHGLTTRYNIPAHPVVTGIFEEPVNPVSDLRAQLVGYLWGSSCQNTLRAGKYFIENNLKEFSDIAETYL